MGDTGKTQFLINGEIWPVILEGLNSADSEVCVIFPWIKYDLFVETLIKVKERFPHIKIKVITSIKKMANGYYDDLEHVENIEKMDEHGIQIKTIYQPFVHCKSVCIDKKVLITGSMNATFSAANLNVEHAIITEDKDSIEKFQKEFKELWHAALLWGAKITR